jgi:hypothetical protein
MKQANRGRNYVKKSEGGCGTAVSLTAEDPHKNIIFISNI